MSLIQDVAAIFVRRHRSGWKQLMALHGLDLNQADLAGELNRALPSIDRTVPGFEDFCPDATRGVEPGVPSKSLLYHALASPLVNPPSQGGGLPDPRAYPALEELDTLENYIYSLANLSSHRLPEGTAIAVFAYQYRIGTRSAHGMFADLSFSRTGLARVGGLPANYDPVRRSFWVDGGTPGTAVMPARYAAFLASPAPDGLTGVIQDKLPDDKGRTFLFPFHKLFSGGECLTDVPELSIRFSEFHRNDKLARLHTKGKIEPTPGFDLTTPPFVRDSLNSPGEMVKLRNAGASVLVVPTPGPLVYTVKQRNSQSGREEMVRFPVPKGSEKTDQRFWTSLQIELGDNVGRAAPEYVNIRHRVHTKRGRQTIEDLNLMPKSGSDPKDDPMVDLVNAGGYEAAHFADGTCDGFVLASAGKLKKKSLAAYSLVTAPHFFPLVDQIDISQWAAQNLVNLQDHFGQGSPEALSAGRLPVNPTLKAATGKEAFDRDDQTMTAVVASVKIGSNSRQAAPSIPIPDNSTSHLPDAASDVFEPGWDVSLARDEDGPFNAAFGLGSPFPEDAKLCAALNSFWPAAAPDTTRTFGLHGSPYATAIPMLDGELGYHPEHPLVLAQAVASSRGWDGEYGPFFDPENRFVNYADKQRSDYVSNALADLVQVTPFRQVSADELIGRMDALRACVQKLPVNPHVVSRSDLLLVSAEKIADWKLRPDRGDIRLQGPGLLYVFARVESRKEENTADVRRLRAPVSATYTCQVAVTGRTAMALCFQAHGAPFQFVLNP
jgi:hypothetical protein